MGEEKIVTNAAAEERRAKLAVLEEKRVALTEDVKALSEQRAAKIAERAKVNEEIFAILREGR